MEVVTVVEVVTAVVAEATWAGDTTAGDTMEADTEAWEATVTIPARLTTPAFSSQATTWEDTATGTGTDTGDGYGNGYSNYYYPSTYGYTDPNTNYAPGYVYPAADGTYVYPVQNATAPAATVVQPTVPIAVSTGTQGAMLGIDEQAVVDALGQGMRVDRVYPGSPAERAGLQVGDVIHSANGYLTQIHGNLTWIINTQAPNGVLNLSVHRASDNRDATVVAQLP